MHTTVDPVLATLEPAQVEAVTIVQRLLHEYNSKDGTGLFSGVARYHVLESRVRIAATQSRSVFEFYSRIMRSMQWPSPRRASDEAFIAHLSAADQHRTLRALAQDTAAIVMLARHTMPQREG